MLTPEGIEKFNQQRYERDYSIAQVSIDKTLDRGDYFKKLVDIKLALIKKYGLGKKVLDIGCGSGDYLFECQNIVSSGVGIDYTQKAIDEAKTKNQKIGASNLDFMNCNARKLPYANETFDVIFSFSSLFYMPHIEDVLKEVLRTLKRSGIVILEMGNLLSLNTIVCNAYPELAKPCHIRTGYMKKIIRNNRLKILQWRSFQILPFWGERPLWLKPLLRPIWKRFLQKEINGKMLDEWISNLPLLKFIAFRHIIVCQKK